MKVIPYLTFNGECEDALNLYKKVFGGEITSLMRYDDAPDMPDMPVSNEWKKKIMHVELKFGDDLWLYLSDVWQGNTVNPGGQVSVHLDVDSETAVTTYLDGLADGGKVTMPAKKMFWGSVYGSVIDKYGISWGFNYSIPG